MPVVPETRLSFHLQKDGRGRKTGKIQAVLKNAHGQVVAESASESREEALTHLLDIACTCIAVLKDGLDVLHFRGRTVVLFPAWYGQWTFAEQDAEKTALHGCTFYDTKAEAELAARDYLALVAWDNQEETSPIITDPERQRRFAESMQYTKRYRFLRAQGWSDQEAQTLLSPFLGPAISQARLDEMPPLPEWAHSGKNA